PGLPPNARPPRYPKTKALSSPGAHKKKDAPPPRGAPAASNTRRALAPRPAGNVDHLPTHKTGLVTDEKCNHIGHVLGLASAAHGRPRCGVFFELLPIRPQAFSRLLRHARLDEPWRDGVHIHAEWPKLDRKRPRQPLQPSFGRGVVRLPAVAQS